MQLLGAYSIEGREVPVELRDITPYYWTDNCFRYFLNRETADGLVTAHMMPNQDGVSASFSKMTDTDKITTIATPERTINTRYPRHNPA